MADYPVQVRHGGSWVKLLEAQSAPAGPLEPHFPITSFVPGSKCPHNRRYKRGSKFVCMVCHQSGKDHHQLAGLPVGSKLNADYLPDPTVTVYAPSKPGTPLTRKQKRAKAAAEREQAKETRSNP